MRLLELESRKPDLGYARCPASKARTRRKANGPRQSNGQAAALLVVLIFVGCTSQAPNETNLSTPKTQPAADHASTQKTPTPNISFLALGDSYTIGEGVKESQRWPRHLARLLNQEEGFVTAPQIIARTGWTTDELATAIAKTAPSGPYELVSLLIGVNDQYRGRRATAYTKPFASLLATALSLAGNQPKKVLVLSIPDWGVTAFAQGRDGNKIAAEIDAYNDIAREQTMAAGAHWVDVTGASRQAGSQAAQLAFDGLHPSGLQYATWARLALPAAVAALSH